MFHETILYLLLGCAEPSEIRRVKLSQTAVSACELRGNPTCLYHVFFLRIFSGFPELANIAKVADFSVRQLKLKQSTSDGKLSSSSESLDSLTSISGNNTRLLSSLSSDSPRELFGVVGAARAPSSSSSSSDEDHTSQRSKSILTYGNCEVRKEKIKLCSVVNNRTTQFFGLSHGRDKPNIPSFLFLSELKIYHLSLFNIITHGAFDIADSSSMHDACHHEPSKRDLCLPVAQWLERPTGVREAMGSIHDGDSNLFFVPRS